MKTFDTIAELAACVGQEVAVSDWITITQQQVNLFAEATGDHQWIHVDVERAKAGPFGAPIAHGFLTLSMLPRFFESTFEVRQVRILYDNKKLGRASNCWRRSFAGWILPRAWCKRPGPGRRVAVS